jgi:phosphoserine phosphatase
LKAFDLVTLDLDHTAFLGNSVLYLNKSLGISEKLEELHAEYREGKISEKTLNVVQAPFLQKVNLERAFEALARGPILKRLDRGVKLLQRNGCDVQMLSFNPFQIFFKKNFGINTDISFLWELDGDHLGAMGEIPEDKVELLKRYCEKNGIDLMNCAHVGDSKNDLATFNEVGFSIALNSSDTIVERAASVSLRTYDFVDVANSILHANDLA